MFPSPLKLVYPPKPDGRDLGTRLLGQSHPGGVKHLELGMPGQLVCVASPPEMRGGYCH